MDTKNREEGTYRVIFIGMKEGQNKESFCKGLSESYGIENSLLKRIVDRSPIVLKKNLSFDKAQALAKTIKAFGGVVSIEEKIKSPLLFLEFQTKAPYFVSLESSSIRKAQSGAWNIMGRIKNVSPEELSDIWALVQLFDRSDELITFEEVPIPLNPLPPGGSSPFKVVFEGSLAIQRASITFKDSSGHHLSTVDHRKNKEWVETGVKDSSENSASQAARPPKEIEEPTSSQTLKADEAFQTYRPFKVRRTVVPTEREITPPDAVESPSEAGIQISTIEPMNPNPVVEPVSDIPLQPEVEAKKEPLLLNHEVKSEAVPRAIDEGNDLDLPLGRAQEKAGEGNSPEFAPVGIRSAVGDIEKTDSEVHDSSQEEPLLLVEMVSDSSDEVFAEIEGEILSSETESVSAETAAEKNEEKKETADFSSLPWIEPFRVVIEEYERSRRDPFVSWFETQQKGSFFAHTVHSVVTILTHSRFDQTGESEKALENTRRVFHLLSKTTLFPEEIPALEEPPFFSGSDWSGLFNRAFPKIRKVSEEVINKEKWDACELERVIQVIPHMGAENSRKALRWFSRLMGDKLEIDLANGFVSVNENLYRVAARFGVVDRDKDIYQGKDSEADIKIQAFAKTAFPQDPVKIEEAMTKIGLRETGHCLPVEPRCEGCLFNDFCAKLLPETDPSLKGLKPNFSS